MQPLHLLAVLSFGVEPNRLALEVPALSISESIEPVPGLEPGGSPYQRLTRACARGQLVEMLGNAPSRPACKARQQSSASIPDGAPAQSRTASCDGRNIATQSVGRGVVSLGGVEPPLASFVARPPDPPAETEGCLLRDLNPYLRAENAAA